MKARQIKRRNIERQRWRLLIERVAQGVEACLVDWLAERWARAAAEVAVTSLPLRADLIRTIQYEVGRSLAQVQELRDACH